MRGPDLNEWFDFKSDYGCTCEGKTSNAIFWSNKAAIKFKKLFISKKYCRIRFESWIFSMFFYWTRFSAQFDVFVALLAFPSLPASARGPGSLQLPQALTMDA